MNILLKTLCGFAYVTMAVSVPGKAQAEPQASHVEACMPCHGEDGIAPASDVPNLAGQNERYLFNQMMAFKSGKRPHKEMRYMARYLSKSDIEALAAYYAALPPR
jgi:cytochrome c553